MSKGEDTNSSEAWWSRVRATTERAKKNNKLSTIDTTAIRIPQAGVDFILRVSSILKKKPQNLAQKNTFNPFAPENLDSDLFVSELYGTHNLLLNKFNVLPHHLLLTTKEFQRQSDPLNHTDFKVASFALKMFRPIIFYNCGKASGASQSHKHMQALPLPLDSERPDELFPIEPLLRRNHEKKNAISNIFRIEEFQFQHACVKLRSYDSVELEDKYKELLSYLGVNPKEQGHSYNILFRVGISVNSVGMVGTMLVKSEEEKEAFIEAGPIEVLRGVSVQIHSKNLQ
ncbi:ATP adenylyltransferase [Planoprotostelium fungivorum]|uniref:ATP adenylyltransferase n=1 Tax=Planoprotostelium fungivorum TaxID=1890364 RepID=A0A2P6MR27_9EUKA|nr:ATP adenylyltransferase [Planoprotostelium fungivorum]